MGLFGDSKIEKNRKVRKSLTGNMIKKLKDTIKKCEKCKRKGGLDVHHIKAISKGGSNVGSNLVVLCPNCHRDAHSSKITQTTLTKITQKRSAKMKKEINSILRNRKKVEGRDTKEKGIIEKIFG